MNEETAFAKNVQSWTKRIVDGGETDFRVLVGRLPGVDPSQVTDALTALDISWPNPVYRDIIRQARSTPNLVAASDWGPFVPHPLDFDWRFTRNTIEELSRTILAIARPERIALLGTPSLVSSLEIETPASTLCLIERNPLWIHHLSGGHPNLEVIEADLSFLQVPSRLLGWADVVVADPPWYPAAQLAYMWAAAQLLRPGGFVLASIPPIGTRPGVAAERDAFNAHAESWGFSNPSVRPAALRYRTPPFELNALRAADILADLAEWRCGDLAVSRRTHAATLHFPKIEKLVEEAWVEVCINGVRIKIKQQPREPVHSDSSSPKLLSLVDGDVLPSVSARHPVRADVDVWTSGNRVFKCKESEAFIELCQNLRDNRVINLAEPRESPMDKRISSLLKPAQRRLANLVSLEFDEYMRRP